MVPLVTEAASKSALESMSLFALVYITYGKVILPTLLGVGIWAYDDVGANRRTVRMHLGGRFHHHHLETHAQCAAMSLNYSGSWLGVFTAPYPINPV